MKLLLLFLFLTIFSFSSGFKKCYECRSRADLGSCKDPFPYQVNATIPEDEKGVEAVACASGWCAKVIEGQGKFKTNSYSIATQRMCLQRGPSDNRERCGPTMWDHKKVFMCFCRGNLCNSAPTTRYLTLTTALSITLLGLSNSLF